MNPIRQSGIVSRLEEIAARRFAIREPFALPPVGHGRRKCRAILLALFAISGIHTRACLWDSDTLAMETARFPGVAELIAGNFPRHSKAFYQWRKRDCEKRLAKDPDWAAMYDDLAVAQHKLGDHRAAIATMEAKEKVQPGLYETESNLGTFYIYTGELETALQHIARALAINPDAHFGREKYQRLLVEWLKEGKPQSLELHAGVDVPMCGFAWFLISRLGLEQASGANWPKQRDAVIKGIGGMMRFADHDNPLLLEALGDVLCAGHFLENGTLLACQAYLVASRRSATDDERRRLWAKMERVGGTVDEFKPKNVIKALEAAQAEAAAYVARVHKDEAAWIHAGRDANAEFARKYLRAGK